MEEISLKANEEIKVYDKPHNGHKWGIYVNVIPKNRPYLFKHDILKQAQHFARFGLTEYQMANIWGVSQRGLLRWKNKTPELCLAIGKGREEANLSITMKLKEACESLNVQAIMFWLTNRQPELWKANNAMINQKIIQGQVLIGKEVSDARKFIDGLDEGKKKQFISSVNRLEIEMQKVENEQVIDATISKE